MNWKLVIASSFGLLAGVGFAQAHEPGGETRTPPYRRGVPLREQLPACENGDVIQFHRHLGALADDPGDLLPEDAIDFSIKRAHLAVVVDVDSVTGVLSEGDSWISTQIAGTVREVLFSRNRVAKGGERITSTFGNAGEAKIGQCIVRTGELLKVAVGRQHLIFMRERLVSPGEPYPTVMPLMIESGRVQNLYALEPGSTTRDPLHGQALELFRARVRATVDPSLRPQ